MIIITIVVILLMISILLMVVGIMQIKMAGMNVTDFWSFIKANDTLDKLYAFSQKYDKLSPQEQVLFLHEADQIFSAFEKVPDQLWEEEYEKYMRVLDKYQTIKLSRWEESSKQV